MKNWTVGLAATALAGSLTMALVSAGCGNGDPTASGATAGTGAGGGNLSGPVALDGSSTVMPIMAGVAEDFGDANPNVKVTVNESGTGGGFKKLCAGEIDIANASRPIKDDEEKLCSAEGIEYVELPVAFDGLSVVVNPKNTWAESLTVDELKKIWNKDSKVKTWADVRPGFPNEKISLYGPGTASGTFDYFTEAVMGDKGNSRSDYQASEHDDVLVKGVSGDVNALGYFGYAYYEANKESLKLVAVNGVKPSRETVLDGTYQPLSRPLFIYVNRKALDEKPQVLELARYALQSGKAAIEQEGYVPLPDAAYTAALARLDQKTTGTAFRDLKPGTKIEEVLKAEASAGK